MAEIIAAMLSGGGAREVDGGQPRQRLVCSAAEHRRRSRSPQHTDPKPLVRGHLRVGSGEGHAQKKIRLKKPLFYLKKTVAGCKWFTFVVEVDS